MPGSIICLISSGDRVTHSECGGPGFEYRMGHQKIIMVSDNGDFFMQKKGKIQTEKAE